MIEESPIRRKDANAVKHIITSETLLCEPKGVDAFEVQNHIHLILCTNEPGAVTAQRDERRYAVLDVSDLRKGQTSYFEQLHSWYADGGKSALLYFLQHHPLDGIDLRIVPATPALLEQKIANFDAIDKTIYEALQDGRIASKYAWGEPIPKDEIVGLIHDERRQFEQEYGPETVGKRLRAIFTTLSETRRGKQAKRIRSWVLPPLVEARADFERYVGQPIEWEEDDATDST